MSNKYIHAWACVYNINYHIVWCVKYRRKVLTPQICDRLYQLVNEIGIEKGFTIAECKVGEGDHIHLLVNCKPQLRLSDAVKILKGNTARWLFLSHPEIKKQLWGGHLWNPSYFVATVSDRTLEQVKTYIDNQKTK